MSEIKILEIVVCVMIVANAVAFGILYETVENAIQDMCFDLGVNDYTPEY